jgi:hypothetical protein
MDKIIVSGVMSLLEKKVAVIMGVTADRYEVIKGLEKKRNPLCSGRAVSDHCEP